MQMDFNADFHPVLMLDFMDVFPIRVVAALHKEYLVEESKLDI